MNRVLAAAVFVVLFSEGLLLAQGYGGVGFPGGGGKGMGSLAAAFCSLTGCTMTGQVVFSGVSTDISTGSGESFTVAPSGAGGIDLQVSTGDINVDTTTGNMTLDCTTANAEGCLRITHAETNGNGIWLESTSGNNTIRMRTPTNTASVALDFISSTSARSAQFAYTNASSTNTDYANKVFVYTNSVEFRINEVNNIAAGTDLFSVNDTAAGSSRVRQFSVDGNGAIKFRVMTSAHGATCNSGNEGLQYYRVIDASNKSGMCMCARTASGTYGWKMADTFGSTPLADGDC